MRWGDCEPPSCLQPLSAVSAPAAPAPPIFVIDNALCLGLSAMDWAELNQRPESCGDDPGFLFAVQ
jgi:hypothetical protein